MKNLIQTSLRSTRPSFSRFSLPLAVLLPALVNAGCAQAQAPASIPAPLTNVARQSEPGAPFINTWLLLGTFDNDAANAGFNRAFINETQAAPQDGQTVAGQSWRYFDDRLFSRNYDDYNDLFSYFDIKQKASVAAKVVYAHSYVYSQTAQNVQLRVGADTAFKAWVNGAIVGGSTLAGPTKRHEGDRQVLSGGRDFVVVPANLNAGWNRLLLKIANVENGRFGFYARFTTNEGNEPRGLEYSVSGGEGELAIENRAMPEAKTGALPVAWREWPYVEAQPDVERLRVLGNGSSGAAGQAPPAIPGLGIGFKYNLGTGLNASPFKLTARGGQSPLVWSKAKGDLPPGMTMQNDGTLSGTPAANVRLGEYSFTAQVRDKAGKTATREYSLTLRERPNRAIEAGRLISLIHGPQDIDPSDIPNQMNQMKRQGYHMAIPTIYNNGDLLFRYPSAFGKKQTKVDVADAYKKAAEAAGINFGIYTGAYDQVELEPRYTQEFPINQQGLVMQEMLTRYPPKALWFDWLGGEVTSVDSFFSVIRSIDPEIVIILNGPERMSNGDWDMISYEGWSAWGPHKSWDTWPAHFPWPKKHTPTSWRASIEAGWPMEPGLTTDWADLLRIQLSMIGEGFVADIDHTTSGYLPTPKGSFDNPVLPLIIQHEKMANWTTRPGLPPLHEAFTQVDPGPLAVSNWGYNTINIKRDAMFLLGLKNPHGKNGLPMTDAFDIGAIPVKVKSVTLMNTGNAIPFSQKEGGGMTLNIQNIKRDEVADIIKIALETPLSPSQAAAPFMPSLSYGPIAQTPTPPGNLATGKPSWLMSASDSHELVPSSRHMAIYGTDGNPATMAIGGGEWAWSYKVDLLRATTIRRVAVVFDATRFATDYRILVSIDGKKWTRVVEVADNQPGSGPGEHSFNIAPIQARFVRLQAIKPDSGKPDVPVPAGQPDPWGGYQKGGQMAIREFQVFETAKAGEPITSLPPRLENLAQGKPSRLLSLDGFRELQSHDNRGAELGVDDDPATSTIALNEWPWTYEVDLQKVATLRGVSITFGLDRWATDYIIRVSRDRQTWKSVVVITANNYNGTRTHAFEPTEARYIRVQALKPDAPGQTGTQMSIAELQVFAAALAGVDVVALNKEYGLTLNKPASIHNVNGTGALDSHRNRGAALGVDDDLTTYAQATQEYPWTYVVDLEEVATVARVNVTFAPDRWATQYNLLASSDGMDWKTIAHVKDNQTAGLKSHTLTPVQARFVGVQAIKPDGPNQPGLQMGVAEFQVFGKK